MYLKQHSNLIANYERFLRIQYNNLRDEELVGVLWMLVSSRNHLKHSIQRKTTILADYSCCFIQFVVSITAKKPVSGRKWPGFGRFFGCGRKWPEVVGLDKASSGVGGRGRKFLKVVGVGRKSSEATALGAITDHYRALNCNSYLLCERRIHSD